MSPINLVLNILWIVFGGLPIALGWAIAGIIMALTIVGLPWARAAFTMAFYALAPFGRHVMRSDEAEGHPTISTGPLGTIGNIIWVLLVGWWLALEHLAFALALAVTVIGLPFAWAHLKLAGLSLWPVGMVIVSDSEAVPPRS